MSLGADPEQAGPGARVRELAEFLWEQSPGHFDGALSKILVSQEMTGSSYLDLRLSSYEPRAHVQRHVHHEKEQVYYFVEGEGLLELDGARHVVRPGSFIFIPPGLEHALHNTGLRNLVFMVITTPTRRPTSPA